MALQLPISMKGSLIHANSLEVHTQVVKLTKLLLLQLPPTTVVATISLIAEEGHQDASSH